MHYSAWREMRRFAATLSKRPKLRILDVGSMDINGSQREFFMDHEYVGLDLTEGKNVDVVGGEYQYPFKDEAFDVVISNQTMEHVKDIYKWMIEITRVAKIGGSVCIIAPSRGRIHRFPVDCWRVQPDGMKFIMEEVAGLEMVVEPYVKQSVDCVGIAKKIRKESKCYQ
jgi:SAM-dependent methyltransferase